MSVSEKHAHAVLYAMNNKIQMLVAVRVDEHELPGAPANLNRRRGLEGRALSLQQHSQAETEHCRNGHRRASHASWTRRRARFFPETKHTQASSRSDMKTLLPFSW